jgi:plasmid stabilization system protein ParE
MGEIIWSEPALSDLDAIADYIALKSPVDASALVERVFSHVAPLAHFRQKRKPCQGTRTIPLPAER